MNTHARFCLGNPNNRQPASKVGELSNSGDEGEVRGRDEKGDQEASEVKGFL